MLRLDEVALKIHSAQKAFIRPLSAFLNHRHRNTPNTLKTRYRTFYGMYMGVDLLVAGANTAEIYNFMEN